MKDFFHKNGVLVLIIALLLTLLVGISSVLMGGQADPLSNVATTVTAPVRSLVSSVLDWADGVYNYVFRYDEMNAELEELRRQVAQLEAELRESGEAARENEQLRQLLKLQAKHQDFVFEAARVTQRSTTNLRDLRDRGAGGRGVRGGEQLLPGLHGDQPRHRDGRPVRAHRLLRHPGGRLLPDGSGKAEAILSAG